MALRWLRTIGLGVLFGVSGGVLAGRAQTPAPETPVPAAPAQEGQEPPRPRGQIVIQSHGDATAERDASGEAGVGGQAAKPGADAKVDVSDAERGALHLVRYDLDARLDLARSGLSVRAQVTVRNDGTEPLRQIPLQISSTLHWESATLLRGMERVPLTLAQHRLDTDADHTGAATEVVLLLPEALNPGASAALDLFYAGTVAQNGDRLARLGASRTQQADADWDAITPEWTGLRGFGNVLWYPVAAPQLFLADGNQLFTAIGRERLHDEAVEVRLRLSVDYAGEPPVAAYFCGRRVDLKALADDLEGTTAGGRGVARAEFPGAPLGFRVPSLFLIRQPEQMVGGLEDGAALKAMPEGLGGPSGSSPAGSSSSSSTPASSSSAAPGEPALHERPAPIEPVTEAPVIALESTEAGVGPGLGTAANRAAALLTEWMGPRPLSALTLLDHEGQPFQDGPLLVAPAAALETSPETPALVYSLTHAWVQTGQPWMDEGLGQFFALLWVEREHGRQAALEQMTELLQPVSLAEPNFGAAGEAGAGQPLITAPDELFYRRKAAAVWWMLRDVAGEKPLRAALSAWRTQAESQEPAAVQAVAFEHLLERLSGKDLGWFFADWVLRDRGLPDLSIENVATSQTPAGAGHSSGWLVAVTVKNEGGAVADVPLTVRSGQFSTTQRLRVPGLATVTERVLVEATPSEVVVNDGSVPELRTAVHSRVLDARTP